MKKVVIAHRWSGSPNSDWYPWLKNELSLLGYEVLIPEIPNPDAPDINTWVNTLYDVVGNPAETFFVGHSIGCQAIMRYLETLPDATKIGGTIFVAPWFNLSPLETEEERRIASPWLTEPINTDKIKEMGEFFAFFTQDDPHVPLDNVAIFENRLGAQTFTFEGGGHLTEDDGVKSIPEVLQKITEMISKK